MLRSEIVEVVAAGLHQDRRLSFPGYSDRFTVPDSYKLMLASLSRLKRDEGDILNLGRTRFTLDLHSVGEALVRRALEVGAEKATDALLEFIEQDHNPYIEVVLLRGLKVPSVYQLQEGVYISSPDMVPSPTLKIYLKEHAEKSGVIDILSPTLPVDYTPSAGCPDSVLFRLKKVKPKFFSRADIESHPIDLEDVNYLRHVSELLVLLSPSIVINRRSYSELQEGAFLYGVTARNWESKYQDAGTGQVYCPSLEELDDFRKTLTAYFALPPARREKLEVPIHRLNEAVRHDSLVDRAIDLGVALEALLLEELEPAAQISLAFRLRGAWLLGADFAERKHIYSLLRDLYNCRSSAAHSGKLSKKAKDVAGAEIALKDGLPLCARAIKDVILRGEEMTSAFWSDLILGGAQ